jgi:Protein of unknown function (DUF3109)
MIIVQDKLVSDDVVKEQFVCNLKACKGACCWEGDSGAPLEKDELPIFDEIFEKVKPYLSPAGLAAIKAHGKYVFFKEAGEWGTTLVNNGPCAYMTLDNGVAQCGIERAWRDGKIEYRKPISCQLYPIRVEKNEAVGFEALNYDRWDICKAACEKGEKEQVAVYQFLKDAIIRKYGEDFYEELDGAAQFLKENE